MHRTLNRLTIVSLLAVFSTACPQKGDETDGSTGGATESTTGDGTDTGTGTDEATDSSTDSDDPTDTAGSESEGTSSEPTTGGPAGLCEAYTGFLQTCGLVGPGGEAEAVAQCEEQRDVNDAVYGPTCALKGDAYLQCLIDEADCGGGACEAELDALSECSPEAGATCSAYADAVLACGGGEEAEDVAGGCQIELNTATLDSPECGVAMEALYGCLGGQSCAEMAEGPGCEAEFAAIEASCDIGEDALVRPGSPEFGAHRR